MQVAADPPGLGRRRQRRSVRDASAQDDALLGRQAEVEPDLDAPFEALGRDLVRAEEHVPRARADRLGAVRRRRPPGVDGEGHLLAAAPAAIPARAGRVAPLVEEPDVERVAAGDERVGVDLVGVLVPHVDLPRARGDLERQMEVALDVTRLVAAGEDDVGRAPHAMAAPLSGSKSTRSRGSTRRWTCVPAVGRTSGAARTFTSAPPTFTSTIVSLPSGSETSTSADCAPRSSASTRSIASGRIPTMTFGARTAWAGCSRQTPSARRSPSCVSAESTFIGGLPMNWATNRLAGRP